jgi:hypothetical protein
MKPGDGNGKAEEDAAGTCAWPDPAKSAMHRADAAKTLARTFLSLSLTAPAPQRFSVKLAQTSV